MDLQVSIKLKKYIFATLVVFLLANSTTGKVLSIFE